MASKRIPRYANLRLIYKKGNVLALLGNDQVRRQCRVRHGAQVGGGDARQQQLNGAGDEGCAGTTASLEIVILKALLIVVALHRGLVLDLSKRLEEMSIQQEAVRI